ncbi:MAG: hypothetical protein H7222_05250 [Methylotenera sp.]|nr:hypothetical protein [Oligoflexia bacterium]
MYKSIRSRVFSPLRLTASTLGGASLGAVALATLIFSVAEVTSVKADDAVQPLAVCRHAFGGMRADMISHQKVCGEQLKLMKQQNSLTSGQMTYLTYVVSKMDGLEHDLTFNPGNTTALVLFNSRGLNEKCAQEKYAEINKKWSAELDHLYKDYHKCHTELKQGFSAEKVSEAKSKEDRGFQPTFTPPEQAAPHGAGAKHVN